MPSSRSALSRWFWPAQIGGWLCYGLQQYLAGVGMLPHVNLQTHLFTLLDMSTGFAASLVLREVLRRSWHWPMGWRVLVGAVAVLVLSAAYGVITVRACPNCRPRRARWATWKPPPCATGWTCRRPVWRRSIPLVRWA